ncbi:Uncharacterized protein ChrSV_4110 [Chromobacterium vaccinii]|nr:Uncharacterized protein ChrSW_4110 [Chromobacterium vaccinii]QND91567.1 Uncharacterized protein ChrSV_4110 [Chromobacterium vaccinii]
MPGRFIPTHVGNSSTMYNENVIEAVHPHARGEQEHAIATAARYAGSSPRTWGTGMDQRMAGAESRFIPTHVGNRQAAQTSAAHPPVHPHARGEQATVTWNASFNRGSSPRTWGTGGGLQKNGRGLRFIPTHVGNRASKTPENGHVPVHPHARGEQATQAKSPAMRGGSSPRTWGTGYAAVEKTRQTRFIPTHVGNSGLGCEESCCRRVHPHARGEQPATSSWRTHRCGSSPRTWGTGLMDCCYWNIWRFIPTHVGNRPIASN